jgi:hypothetical protein
METIRITCPRCGGDRLATVEHLYAHYPIAGWSRAEDTFAWDGPAEVVWETAETVYDEEDRGYLLHCRDCAHEWGYPPPQDALPQDAPSDDARHELRR